MKKTELLTTMNRTVHKVSFKLKQRSPEILVAAGIVGVVTSAVLACRATTKAGKIVEETKKEVMNMLKKTIRPEFLNRIDETIMFLPLTEPEIKQIVVLQIKSVQKMLSGNGVELVLTNAAIDFLANAGYDPEFGARPVKRAIQHYLLNDLSKKLLAQEVDRSKPITVDASTTDDGLVFRN